LSIGFFGAASESRVCFSTGKGFSLWVRPSEPAEKDALTVVEFFFGQTIDIDKFDKRKIFESLVQTLGCARKN
jgi:hypothetical protein